MKKFSRKLIGNIMIISIVAVVATLMYWFLTWVGTSEGIPINEEFQFLAIFVSLVVGGVSAIWPSLFIYIDVITPPSERYEKY